MKVRGTFGNMRVWKWSLILLTAISFLLGSAYYSIDNMTTVIVDIDVNGQFQESGLIGENSTNNNAQTELNSSHKFGHTPTKDSLSTPESRRVTDNVSDIVQKIQEAKKRLAEKYNKHLLGTLADKVNTDDNRSENKLDLADQEFKTTDFFSSTTSTDTEKETDATKRIYIQSGDIDASGEVDDVKDYKTSTKELSEKQVSKVNPVKRNKMPLSPWLRMKNKKRVTGDTYGGNKNYPGRPRLRTAIKDKLKKHRLKVHYDIPVEPDTSYAIQNLESLRINKTESSTFVLLVTYARSGSTWLGDITNQAQETFYVFEPLQRLIVQGYYKENLVCYNNNTCRKPRLFLESHKFAITTFHRLFTCQFTKLHPVAVRVFVKNVKSGNFKNCIKVSSSVKKCLQELEKVCLTATHRALKTIRVSMELVNIMMDLWPNLKVVNLIRDPRGITNSRIKKKTFAMVKQIVPHSHNMCDRMFEDVAYNTVLEKKHKDHIRLVFYEALAERPLDGAKFIYKFLDLNLTQDVVIWVYNSTHAQKKSGYYGTMRSDAVENAYHWRKELTLNKIKTIDSICSDVYELLGFLPMNTKAGLLNYNITPRQPMKYSNWFC